VITSPPEKPMADDLEQALKRIRQLEAVLQTMRSQAYAMRRQIRADRPVPREISEIFWAWAKTCEQALEARDDD